MNQCAQGDLSKRLHIRPYQAGDAESVSVIIRTTMRISNSADYAPERLQPLIDYFSPAKVDQINQTRTCFVVEADGVVIATAGLEDAELVTFFVLPDWQGQGIGASLLRQLEAAARAQGINELKVDASVTGAPFYERHGYRRSGEILEGTAGPQVSMHKRLDSGFSILK